MDFELGDVVKFIDTDPEYYREYGLVGTVICLYPPEDKPGCEEPLVQVDCHGSYLISRPDQLEKLL